MKSPGIPTYTQRSVAFPLSGQHDRIVDEISVSFDAKGGGTHGEFSFEWVSLGPPEPSLRVMVFAESFQQLLDERILELLHIIRKHKVASPEQLIAWLEAAGFHPSIYHLRGLDTGNLTLAEKAELEQKMARLRRHEGS